MHQISGIKCICFHGFSETLEFLITNRNLLFYRDAFDLCFYQAILNTLKYQGEKLLCFCSVFAVMM